MQGDIANVYPKSFFSNKWDVLPSLVFDIVEAYLHNSFEVLLELTGTVFGIVVLMHSLYNTSIVLLYCILCCLFLCCRMY